MTEQEFREYSEKAHEKGRAPHVSMAMDNPDPETQAAGQYMGEGHALLPDDYQNMSESVILGAGELLFKEKTDLRTKETVLILLAHQPSEYSVNITKIRTRN
jgi:hypothetical protein